jgi:hypothetical protein
MNKLMFGKSHCLYSFPESKRERGNILNGLPFCGLLKQMLYAAITELQRL